LSDRTGAGGDRLRGRRLPLARVARARRPRRDGELDDGGLREPRRPARAGRDRRADLPHRVLRAAAAAEPLLLPRADAPGGAYRRRADALRDAADLTPPT